MQLLHSPIYFFFFPFWSVFSDKTETLIYEKYKILLLCLQRQGQVWTRHSAWGTLRREKGYPTSSVLTFWTDSAWIQLSYRETTNMMCFASFINCVQAIQWLFCQVCSGTQISRSVQHQKLAFLPVLTSVACKHSSCVSVTLDTALSTHTLDSMITSCWDKQ